MSTPTPHVPPEGTSVPHSTTPLTRIPQDTPVGLAVLLVAACLAEDLGWDPAEALRAARECFHEPDSTTQDVEVQP